MAKILGVIAFVLLIFLPVTLIIAGQLGLLKGSRPNDLGLKEGLLKPPIVKSWNVVSSHAEKQAHTDYHTIAPLKYSGDAKAAFTKLETIVRATDGASIITNQGSYLYAEYQSSLFKFVDDVEFVLDESAGVIHMRSASRLGRKDFGANRARLEAIRLAMGG